MAPAVPAVDRPGLVQTRPTGLGRARGLVSSRESGRRIHAVTYAPPADLVPVVATFWSGAWDLSGQSPHVTELISDPCLNFAFETAGDHAGSRLVGVWTRLWTRKLEGRGRVFGVKLRAGAARAFIDAPAHRWTHRIAPLSEAFERAHAIEREVLSTDDDEVAFAAITTWLRAHRTADLAEVSLAIALVDRICQDQEVITVERLSAVAGMGVRALQRIFREHVGASPKWVIRRNRLQEVALRIERGEERTIADLAAALGYTDQAHLTRDFKNAVGKSPRALLESLRAR